MALDLDGLDGVRRTRAAATPAEAGTPAAPPPARARVITPPPLPEDAPPGADAAAAPEVTMPVQAPPLRTAQLWLALPLMFAAAVVALVLVYRDRAPLAPPAATPAPAPRPRVAAAELDEPPPLVPPPAATAPAATAPAAARPAPRAMAPLDVVLPARFGFNERLPVGDADTIAAVVRKCAGDIVLTGHTDAIGPARANRDIALERADAVRALLAARGVDAARVHIAGAGSTEPVASNKSAAGRRANRRVTLSCAPHPGGDE